MEKKVTARFLKIESERPFEELLQQTFDAHSLPVDREKTLASDYYIRLERLESGISTEGGRELFVGEILRRQTTNFPSDVHDSHVVPLSISGSGLGHSIVFAYIPKLSVLALQYEIRVLSIVKFLQYFDSTTSDLKASPVLRRDALTRLAKGEIRRFRVKYAPVENPNIIDQAAAEIGIDASDFSKSIKVLGDFMEGLEVDVSIGFGRKKGSLNKSKLLDLIKFYTQQDPTKMLCLRADIKDDEESKAINFLDDMLTRSDEIDLDPKDPSQVFERKKTWIVDTVNANEAYLNDLLND